MDEATYNGEFTVSPRFSSRFGLREEFPKTALKAGVEAETVAFIEDMAARYAWCDVMVARAGAVTVAEIAAAGVASILFPLPWVVADEQAGNARWLADRGAATHLKQLETTPATLAALLAGLTREGLAAVAAKARALGRPDATARCAALCEGLAK